MQTEPARPIRKSSASQTPLAAFTLMSIAAVLALAPNPCAAQCQLDWTPFSGFPGFGDQVNAIIEWDPDGAGPQAPWTVFGGEFSIAGNVQAQSVVAWNGAEFIPMGEGLGTSSGDVRAFAIYNGELIAAGYFTTSGGTPVSRIARWDGAAWQPLGDGVGYRHVNALAVYNGLLIVGGDFSIAGGNGNCNSVAAWNGQDWSALATGVGGVVRDICVYNNELYVAGEYIYQGTGGFEHIAKWNGVTWQSVGSRLGDFCFQLHEFDGKLIASGRFVAASATIVNHIAALDGSQWTSLGGGIDIMPQSMATRNGK